MMRDKLLFENVSKIYGEGVNKVTALDNISLNVKAGEFVAIVGPSGSGKSTFLSIAGALLSPSEGRLLLNDEDITSLSSKELTRVRLEKIGFVFQSSNLVPYLTVRDQLLLISELIGKRDKKTVKKRTNCLAILDLEIGQITCLKHCRAESGSV